MTTVLISKREAAARIGVNPATLMRMVTERRFPAPVRLGDFPLAENRFIESEIEEWIAERIVARDGKPKRREPVKVKVRRKRKAAGVTKAMLFANGTLTRPGKVRRRTPANIGDEIR